MSHMKLAILFFQNTVFSFLFLPELLLDKLVLLFNQFYKTIPCNLFSINRNCFGVQEMFIVSEVCPKCDFPYRSINFLHVSFRSGQSISRISSSS